MLSLAQTGVVGMRLNGKNFLFIKDTLGSITEIIDENGGLYAQYVYDAWGNIIAKTTGGLTDINPFRYRGYYMDVETSWYYLQTRYYDPVVRRFINADNYELIPFLSGSIGELNLYSYCNNNPVMYTDETGQFVLSLFLAAVISGVIIGGIYGGMTAEANGQNFWAGVGIGALAGGLMGAVGYFLTPVVFAGGMSTVIGLSSTFVLSSVIGFGADASLQQINYGSVDWKSAAWSGVQWGALNTLNVLTAGMAGNLSAGAVFALGLFANAMYGALGILGDVIRGRQPNQFIYT